MSSSLKIFERQVIALESVMDELLADVNCDECAEAAIHYLRNAIAFLRDRETSRLSR